jgi:hypothetical protein
MADTRTLDRYIYATFTFINTQLLERRLCVVLCIYVFTTRIPRASQQGFAAYQAFVLLYTPQPTMLVGVALGSFFMGGDRDREREMKFEFLDKRVFLGHTNGGEVIWIMEEYSAEQSW